MGVLAGGTETAFHAPASGTWGGSGERRLVQDEPKAKPMVASAKTPVYEPLALPLDRGAILGAEDLVGAAWTSTDEQVSLGRRLFFDPLLSKDKSLSCASCHKPELAFADDLALSKGVDGHRTLTNAPSLINKSLSTNLFWDGRAATLELQVLQPIENPLEMDLSLGDALERLNAVPAYVTEFEGAYDGAPTEASLALALSAFVRTLVVGNSPVDRFRAGDSTALSGDERAGLWIFEGRGGCWRCHNGSNFSDESFHNTGIGALDGIPEAGRADVTGKAENLGEFRTPGLRLLTKTAPYMHDGSLQTLEEVLEFYRKGGSPNSNLSSEMEGVKLAEGDVKPLAAFLRSLSR
jgi:cytochrome c peroxidase